MLLQLDNLRSLYLTAARAGVRRTLARVRRILMLRIVYPRFGERLYPLRAVALAPLERPAKTPLLARCASSEVWDGRITLLNTPAIEMRVPVDWNANPIQHTLWQFRLHEWEWALPLIRRAEDDEGAANELVGLIQDYLQNVPLRHATAFEPYPLSRRLVVWCEALWVLKARVGHAAFVEFLAAEMDRGARMLANNLEYDLSNNHLIANAKALAFVGMLLAQPYGEKGLRLFWEELRSQVRSDGGHVENSTTYHFLVWRDAVETCELASQYGVEIPKDATARIEAMCVFLVEIRYHDGSFPLLNDSVEDELREYESVARLSKVSSDDSIGKTAKVLGDSGYAVLRDTDTQLVFDAGALGPSYCPGHGHADTLSFELFAFGRLRIGDGGTFQYQAGEWRDYFRGTAAHNTLQVDGLDSSEVSGSFRVGRMANARLWTEGEWVCGEHDGYMRLREGIVHTRKIQAQDRNLYLIHDEIRGRGTHDYALRFHLAPNAQATVLRNAVTAQFDDKVRMEIEIAGAGGTIEIADGWVSPTWYTKFAAQVVEWKWRGEPPFAIETRIRIKGIGSDR